MSFFLKKKKERKKRKKVTETKFFNLLYEKNSIIKLLSNIYLSSFFIVNGIVVSSNASMRRIMLFIY